MWGHTLTVRDYQDLIDRGWRRSVYFSPELKQLYFLVTQVRPVLLQADHGPHMLPALHDQVQRHRVPVVQVPEESAEEVQELFDA